MKLSILMPSYNQGAYVEAAILSVLSQPVADVQLIVMDGGSTDGTVEILRRYRDRISVCVSEPDGGQADALNKALRHAQGDVIGWLNSDDVYLSGCFQRIMQRFIASPEIDVVYGDRILIDGRDRVIGWYCGKEFRPDRYGYNLNSEAAFWRRSAPDGGFDASLRFTMDLDWFCRMYARGRRFSKMDSFLGAFRCHASNKSTTMQDVCVVETELCWRRIFGNEYWKVSPPHAGVRSYTCLLRNPLTLTWPYLKYRVQRQLLEKVPQSEAA